MDEHLLPEQANAVARTLSGLMRCFSRIEPGDPATELPVAQLRVCSILRDGPRTMSCLSSELGISLSAITQIADRLERAGMVDRVPETQDRRVKVLQLTQSGREVMKCRAEKRVHRISQALLELPPESRDTVLAAMRMLLDAGLAVHLTADIVSAEPPVEPLE